MSQVATAMPKPEEAPVTYVTVKIDGRILPLVKAAAALAEKTVQEWLSDLANEQASKEIGRKPLLRPKPED